jgi:hypothetical protein
MLEERRRILNMLAEGKIPRLPWRKRTHEYRAIRLDRHGSDYRHITYDERARGKSKRSADYSFEACIRDVDAVLKARGVLRGWAWLRG